MLWGLAHSGEDGAFNVLRLLAKEFEDAMARAGCATVDDINRDCLCVCEVDEEARKAAVPVRLKLTQLQEAAAGSIGGTAPQLRARL